MSELSHQIEAKAAQVVARLRSALLEYRTVCYASSLGPESSVLTDLIWGAIPQIEVFTIDTGRLFPETYDLIERVQRHYDRALRVFYPDSTAIEHWVAANGVNGFRDGVERRSACCAVRKLAPFKRAVAGYGAWVTGVRREQSASRALGAPVEWDPTNGLHKISPLLDWSEDEVWGYIRGHRLPYNVLHDRGYPSIGCAPCTRAVELGEDSRGGRWWWEREGARECGLHPRRTAT